jgi:hypothetical protein
VAPLAIYGLTVFWILPAINSSLGQVRLNFAAVVLNGVYQAVFDTPATTNGSLRLRYAPVNLIETALSAHVIPFRHVPGSWTYQAPFHVFDWDPNDQIWLGIVLAILTLLWLATSREDRRPVYWLAIGFACFVLAQALLIRPLAPVLLEVTYYASFSSFWLPFMVARMLASGPSDARRNAICWLLVCFFLLVEFTNHEATARRHPYWSDPSLSWADLRTAQREVFEGRFADVIEHWPFPHRLYFFAYEMELARRNQLGDMVDLRARQPTEGLPINSAPPSAYRDNVVLGASALEPRDEQALIANATATALPPGKLAQLLQGSTLRGQSGKWGFIRKVESNGDFSELVWFDGLMRQWYMRGRLALDARGVCVIFVTAPPECISRAYLVDGNLLYGFSSDGAPVTHFRIARK